MECDNKYMRDKVDKVAPGWNLMPVWMTNDLSKVTTEPVVATYKMLGKDNLNLSLIKNLFQRFLLTSSLVLMYQIAHSLAISLQQKQNSS